MIKIKLGGTALVKGLNDTVLQDLEEMLTYKNPKYQDALRHGRYIGDKVQPYLYYFARKKNNIVIPRGMLNYLMGKIWDEDVQLKDNTVCPAMSEEYEFTSTLRDYQKPAVKDACSKRYGILEASTGAGKTVMATSYVIRRKTRALVLVHSKELQNQWVEQFHKHTNIVDIGLIGNGHYECRDVTIGIINSVYTRLDDLKDKFGTLILDECHRAIGEMWIKTINGLRPKYQLGLSATPFRRDKLTRVLYQMIGPQLHKVDRKQLQSSGAILVPEIIRKTTGFTYNFQNDYSSMLACLTKDEKRNAQIADDIIKDYKRYGEPIMVVTDRVHHCNTICELLRRHKLMKPVVLTGKMTKDKRRKNVDSIKAGISNVLIATVSLLGEGFDAPDLSALFLASPIKFGGRVIQVGGRILRPSGSGEAPRIYDYRDNRIKTFLHMGWSRDRTYRSLGW